MLQSYRDLDVWKKSMKLAELVYRLTQMLSSEEKFGLTSQMRRAAVSIPSNIAEGYRRSGRKDYVKFVRYAFGSGSELETQLELIIRLKLTPETETKIVSMHLDEVMKMLAGFIKNLERSES